MKQNTAACDPRFSRNAEPPRIILLGAGVFNGLFSRQAMKKGWSIVAVANRAGDKVDKDWGRLTGMKQDIGLAVQDFETIEFHEYRADIAVVAMSDRLRDNMPAYRKLLDAGINVLCLGCESYFPQAMDAQLAHEIDARAKANGVTFTGTGTWDYSRIWPGIIMAGACLEIASLHHASLTNLGREERYAREVGIGMTPEEFHRHVVLDSASRAAGFVYHLNLQLVLSALGYHITEVTETREPVLYDHPVFCPGLKLAIEPGMCAGLRKNIVVETREGVRATGQIDLRLIEPGEVENMRWAIEGAPGSDISIARRNNTPLATVACLMNRVPDVISAEPGIRLITELGPLKSTSLI